MASDDLQNFKKKYVRLSECKENVRKTHRYKKIYIIKIMLFLTHFIII